MYKLVGNEMLVLPNKFVDELRSIPEQRLSSMIANIDVCGPGQKSTFMLTLCAVQNFQGNYSTIDILLEGNLHTHVIQTRLTPKLGTLVAPICQEIRQSLATELPPCKGIKDSPV